MRRSEQTTVSNEYKIIAVDDERGIIDSLTVFLKRSGYQLVGVTDPMEAIERVRNEEFDLMLLDYIMTPIHGDKVVEEIRKFNDRLYILLLTGHKDLAPPLETIRKLSIQGYCEKSDRFDQLLLLIESAIKSIEQIKIIEKINKELKQSKADLERAYLESIQTLRYTVEAKDQYTRGHSDRVSEYSVLIGEHLGISDEQLKQLRIGGLFHDIGKIGVPDGVLLKNAKLSDEEYSSIKNHPAIGKHILSTATLFKELVPIVYHHHEKFDGTGYPGKYKGEEIPYLARITAVADTFDAMTSKRSYRDALDLTIARDEIERCSGTQFDPEIVKAFLEIFDTKKERILDIIKRYSEDELKKENRDIK